MQYLEYVDILNNTDDLVGCINLTKQVFLGWKYWLEVMYVVREGLLKDRVDNYKYDETGSTMDLLDLPSGWKICRY